MASPQLENGYTRIANEIMEALIRIRINGEARQILDAVIRKTYGFGKKEDCIALSQFCLMTGLKKNAVCKALSKLKSMNLITQKENGTANIYSINKNFDEWKPLPKKRTLPKKRMTIPQKVNNRTPKRDIQKKKETITKEIYTPSGVERLTNNKKQPMRKNKMGSYREDISSDSFEEVIDADTGQSAFPKVVASQVATELLVWAEERRGQKFIQKPKQYSALKKLRLAGISPKEVKQRYVELENTDFGKKVGVDFTSVLNSFDKKR